MEDSKTDLPEIWGGIECTINRFQERFTDQLDLGNFYKHPEYLDAIIELGISNIRFPILWEKHQSKLGKSIDWTFTENYLAKLQKNKIIPIAGLLHHGSGPAFTSLTQNEFPELFAAYASQVARKFPWIEYYTPVNEPLTTARFSGLYGIWYPHKKNDVSFIKILLNELKATVLAMQEIRKVNPNAKLVQTEDLGKTYSTALLSYQSQFENHRRWLTYDFLCGKFTPEHPLWKHVLRLGIPVEKLQFFIDNPCAPDIIGVNHYVTSERYLDENITNYPVSSIGGNTLHQYSDIDAARVEINEPHGLGHLLHEIWDRYHIQLVITEAHLHCTREDQLRWLNEIYEIAVKVKNEGVNIKAVTPWALLGSYGWNKLLIGDNFEYETGAFDISAGFARPTALSILIKKLISQQGITKHLINQSGWWKRSSRLYQQEEASADLLEESAPQPIIIIGNSGTLGQAFSRICSQRNIHHLLLGRTEADICNKQKLENIIDTYKPWAIINTAGYVKVEEAESEKQLCYQQNTIGAENLSAVCAANDVKLMTFSTDLVFNGEKKSPYVETDATNPLNTYGYSKKLAEEAILRTNPGALIIRTAAFFGPWDRHNFVYRLLSTLEQNKSFSASDDLTVSPTYLPHLVNASLDLLIDDASGIWHLINKGCITWFDFAKKIIDYTNLDDRLLLPVYQQSRAAKMPAFSALESNKYTLMPSLEEALSSYFSSQKVLDKSFTIQRWAYERI